MAVSKRLRFEILRRDNHTCYYCGRKPPEVELTIDHVLPQALGGTDDATNLVTCCKECNSGKTSVAPGSALVARVDEDALRWSAAMQAAIVKAGEDHDAVAAYRNQFLEAWNDYKQPAPLDENWRISVETFRTRGLPLEILVDAAHRAMARSNIGRDSKFKYMCGIAWSKVTDIEQDARRILKAETADEDDETRDPTLAEELLPLLGQHVVERYLAERVQFHAEYGEEEDAEPTKAELEREAIVMALYDLDGERIRLWRAVESLLTLGPAKPVWDAMDAARAALIRDGIDPNAPDGSSEGRFWHRTAVLFIDAQAEDFMAALDDNERAEWIRYAHSYKGPSLDGWGGKPSEQRVAQLAGKLALERLAGWRPVEMCNRRGEHIVACPERGTSRIALSGCAECGIKPSPAGLGMLVCDGHLEDAVSNGLIDVADHTITVTDFVVLEPQETEEAPF